MKTSHKILIGVLVVIVLGLLARFVVFKESFDEWGAGLQRVEDWQTDYKRQNPNATKAEMDAAFESGIDNIKAWQENYMRENPNATKAEMDAAFNAAWNK